MWLTLEAKSEQDSNGLLGLNYLRQVNTQLDQLASDQGMEHPPAGSSAIIISDRLSVDPQHVQTANANVYMVTSDVLRDIEADVAVVWADLLGTAVGIASDTDQKKHIRSVLNANGCLPSQVIDRLTQNRIRPGD